MPLAAEVRPVRHRTGFAGARTNSELGATKSASDRVVNSYTYAKR